MDNASLMTGRSIWSRITVVRSLFRSAYNNLLYCHWELAWCVCFFFCCVIS